eukprot:gene6470-8900_t
MAASLQSVIYSRGSLKVIDQLLLPHELSYITLNDSQDAWNVIRSMQVRGAPLIAITAALGLAIEAHHLLVSEKAQKFSLIEASAFLQEKLSFLRTSRPTAVNLFVATDYLSSLVVQNASNSNSSVSSLIESYIIAAEEMLRIDITNNKSIGINGANKILELVNRPKVRVLTICNTGSLATAGYGTALGVVRSLSELGKLEHVYACETRPYNQGARLTAFEIVQDKLPGTLITDSMASALMSVKGVDCVVVGADRVAANGDTANKIGTYQLAIAAHYHNIPFFAAVPTTSIDLTIASGAEIPIEERPAVELTSIFGQKIAPDGIAAWNPAFDVTPSSLIRGIITELGVIEAPIHTRTQLSSNSAAADGIIPIASFLKINSNTKQELLERINNAITPSSSVSTGYVRMNETALIDYIRNNTKLLSLLDLSNNIELFEPSSLKINEIGDGNLNFVYIIQGNNNKKIIIKQALPYVRCVGESWPLTLERAFFENTALESEIELTNGKFVPEVYHFDKPNSLIVMRYIEEPHIILRKALISKMKITSFANDIGVFLAETLFGSSGLSLDGGALRARISFWSKNNAMCALTEKVIFSDPYATSPNNHWTSPQLDDTVKELQSDEHLKLAAAYHKSLFLTKTQALLHGDLHTGSVMVDEGSTFVIDPEFAFYGPMGFDIGAIISNLLLSYYAHSSLGENDPNSQEYSLWVLQQIVELYNKFLIAFLELWNKQTNTCNDTVNELYLKEIYNGSFLKKAQDDFLQSIWRDSLGFTGMKMIRRIVGIAHVADLESISDFNIRSKAEKRALSFASVLVKASYDNQVDMKGLSNVESLVKAAIAH